MSPSILVILSSCHLVFFFFTFLVTLSSCFLISLSPSILLVTLSPSFLVSAPNSCYSLPSLQSNCCSGSPRLSHASLPALAPAASDHKCRNAGTGLHCALLMLTTHCDKGNNATRYFHQCIKVGDNVNTPGLGVTAFIWLSHLLQQSHV